MYRIDDLQACEPSALNWRAGVQIDFADERDSMGFDRVSIAAETPGELVTFLGTHWGKDDPAWFTETLQGMYEVDPAADLEPGDAPEGYRRIRFTDAEDTGQTWEGIVRADAGPYVYPYVSRGTARAIAAELHSFYPTPMAGHRNLTAWFEVDELFDGTHEFVMYEEPGAFDADAYDANGYPKDSDAWGTTNLLDDPKYAAAFPASADDDGGREWVDLGALGLVWVELPTVLDAAAQDALSDTLD